MSESSKGQEARPRGLAGLRRVPISATATGSIRTSVRLMMAQSHAEGPNCGHAQD